MIETQVTLKLNNLKYFSDAKDAMVLAKEGLDKLFHFQLHNDVLLKVLLDDVLLNDALLNDVLLNDVLLNDVLLKST